MVWQYTAVFPRPRPAFGLSASSRLVWGQKRKKVNKWVGSTSVTFHQQANISKSFDIHIHAVFLTRFFLKKKKERRGEGFSQKTYEPTKHLGCSLLLRFFSSRLKRFSSRRRASSASWCCRHLWKFSTTTPTNMLSTKKLTMSKKEMK